MPSPRLRRARRAGDLRPWRGDDSAFRRARPSPLWGDRDGKMELTQRVAQEVPGGRIQAQIFGYLVELGLSYLKRIECLSRLLWGLPGDRWTYFRTHVDRLTHYALRHDLLLEFL